MIKKILYGIGAVALGLTLTYGKANAEHLKVPNVASEVYSMRHVYCEGDRIPDLQMRLQLIVPNQTPIPSVEKPIPVWVVYRTFFDEAKKYLQAEPYPMILLRWDTMGKSTDFDRDGHYDAVETEFEDSPCFTLEKVLEKEKEGIKI